MFAKFFIERPVLANVIACVMILLGAVAVFVLPVSEYPPITPIRVDCTWEVSALADFEHSPAIHRRVSMEKGSVVASRRLKGIASNR